MVINMAVEHAQSDDHRFQLDERFNEKFPERLKKKKKLPQYTTKKQGRTSFENKVIVRYDPTLPDHEKFELKSEKDRKRALQHGSTAKSEKKRKKKEKLSRVEAAPQPVSEQTFVKISSDLKGYFQKKEKKNEGFSILKMLEENESSENDEVEVEEPHVQKQKLTEDIFSVKRLQSSEKESKPEILNIERINLDKGTKTTYKEEEKQDATSVDRREYYNPKKGKIYCPENGVWYDTLFLKEGDMRLEDGIRWLNTRPELPENWAKFRREIFFDALQKQQKSFKKLNSLKNPHQQRREHQLNKARKYIHRSIKMKRGK